MESRSGSSGRLKATASGSQPARSKGKRSARAGNIAQVTRSLAVSKDSVQYGGSTSPNDSGRPCPEHSFLTDVADVRQMEHGLLQLLENFHSGKLQAFGQECPFEKMDQVREQQEKLARLHFELDSQQEMTGVDTAEGRETANKNMNKLMTNLQELCSSIQELQKNETNTSYTHL